jgi:hypothetical protein
MSLNNKLREISFNRENSHMSGNWLDLEADVRIIINRILWKWDRKDWTRLSGSK